LSEPGAVATTGQRVNLKTDEVRVNLSSIGSASQEQDSGLPRWKLPSWNGAQNVGLLSLDKDSGFPNAFATFTQAKFPQTARQG